MKALTVRQPWASLITSGVKQVENRAWRTNHRGRLAIHAARAVDKTADSHGLILSELPRGAVIGLVDLIDCHPASECGLTCSAFAEPDCWHWVLRDPVELPVPVLAKGQVRPWEWRA